MVEISVLAGGVTVLGETRSGGDGAPATVSACIYLPCGVIFDPPDQIGASLVLAEIFNRGTSTLSSKEFRAKFEKRGMHFIAGGGFERSVVRLDCLVTHFRDGVKLVSEALRTPRVGDFASIAESKRMLINDIRARDDDSAGLASKALTELFFTEPFNRPREGSESGILSVGEKQLNASLSEALSAGSVIFSWCGSISQEQVLEIIESEFALPQRAKREIPRCFAVNTQDISPLHIARPTEQRSVMIAFESASVKEGGYYPAKVASLILGGGLSARLFDEVREKRGLVYDISCSHSSNRDRGWFVVGFACAPERFKQAVTVTRSVMSDFVPTARELARARSQIRLSLAAGSESRAARCETLASEWSYYGRVRSDEELIAAVNDVTPDRIQKLWEAYPPFRHAVEVSVGGDA